MKSESQVILPFFSCRAGLSSVPQLKRATVLAESSNLPNKFATFYSLNGLKLFAFISFKLISQIIKKKMGVEFCNKNHEHQCRPDKNDLKQNKGTNNNHIIGWELTVEIYNVIFS